MIIDAETGELKQELKEDPESIPSLGQKTLDAELSKLEMWIQGLPDASFVGDGAIVFTGGEVESIATIANETLLAANPEQQDRACGILRQAATKRFVAGSSTGVIVAGFGADELFPTLVSFELEGVVGNRLKFAETNAVDIDREGTRARVLPFAQREMVERFLHGLDTPLRRQISDFCRSAIPKISEALLQNLDMTPADTEEFGKQAALAEMAFYEGLEKDGFEAIQSTSEAEIEDMVEFMPKAEMARMAEALVNLTSIKRRVSRGFETVGGPIDVAIVSKAEGFVWVSRKHYFPRELNDRFFARRGREPEEDQR